MGITYAGAAWRQRLVMAILVLAVGSQARTSMSKLMQAHPEKFGVKESDPVNRVMGYPDVDKDGHPDTNTSSTCYRNGEAIATVVAVPNYYLGMLTYYLLTPVISVKEQLREVLGAFRIIAFPFNLKPTWYVLGYVRYPFDRLFTCLPCSLSVIIKGLIELMGPAAFETFCCLFFIYKLATYHVTGHKSLAAALIVVAPVFAGYVYVHSSGPGYEALGPLQPLTTIVFCPFQLASGMSAAVSGSMEYWVACMDIICLAFVLLFMALLFVRPMQERALLFLKARKTKGNAVQPTAKVAKGGGAAERSGTKKKKTAVVERNQPQDRTKERMSRIETVDWTQWLADNKLADFESSFRSEMGVTHVSDLTFVTADDLTGIGMGTLKQRRFLQAVKESL